MSDTIAVLVGGYGPVAPSSRFLRAWQAKITYKVNEEVVYENALYACIKEHTSGEAFVEAGNWSPIATSSALTAEATRAKVGEKAAEEGATAAATSKMKAEEERAKAAETINATAITAEAARAEGAEGTLTTNLSAEVAARTTAVAAAITTAEAASDTAGTAAADVKVEKERAEAAEVLKAPLASPALTGTPKAPTAAAKTNTEQIATTAFAQTARGEAEAASDKAGAAATAKAEAEAAATAKTKAEEEARKTAVTAEETRAKAAEKAAQESAEAASIATGQRGATNGVAKLEGGRLPVGELPLSALILEPKELGEVEGVTKLTGSEGTIFSAKLKGATEFEVSPPHEPWIAQLELTPGKFTWKVKGASWVGSEPEFGEGKALVTILCWKGEVLLLAGTEGRKGEKGTAGEKGAAGEKGESGNTSTDAFLKTAAPVFARSLAPTGETAIGVAFKAVFVRVVIPIGGTLHDLNIFNESVVNGNHNIAVFDMGQIKAGEYTLLWESGSVAATGEKQWQKVGDPALAVTAGEALMFAIMNSGTTHKFGQITGNGVGRAYELPENFMPVSGTALPKLCAVHTFAELKYATIKEAEAERAALPLVIIGRIA